MNTIAAFPAGSSNANSGSPVNATKSPIPGPKILLLGDSGTGKTYSIRSLIAQGITPFVIFTEPGQEVLSDLPAKSLHWTYVAPATQDWSAMLDVASKINTFSFESLTKMVDGNKRKYNQFEDLLRALNNFKCDRTGEEFGDVTTWGTNRAIVVDSLSGVNLMAMALAVGGKPVRDQKDWGLAQTLVSTLMQKLCMDTRCMLIVTAHPEREVDEVLGGSKVMVSTLGKKLAPILPRFFSDVIMSERNGTTFSWTTAAVGAALKSRNLPISDKLTPSFEALIGKWKQQGGVIEA